MSRIFLDSNICVFAFDRRVTDKQNAARELLKENPLKPFISSQVIIETYNASRRKLNFTESVCEENVRVLTDICSIVEIKESTIRAALEVKERYKFSFLDSVILATALENNCTILYSQDMQHKQVISFKKKRLTIINPFV